MLYIRERRSRLAVVWLIGQVAAIAFAAASLPHASGFTAAVTTCTCPGDHPDEACPMHKVGGSASDESEDCSMRSAHVATDAALMALTTGLGLPASSSMVIGPASTRPIRDVAVTAVSVVDLPDSPPPRA